MKFLIVSSLLFLFFLASVTAQIQTCGGRSWIPYCGQPKNSGNRGPLCPPPSIMWYYDRSVRRCRRMLYLGCNGNGNRWCRYTVCERRCARR